MNPNQIAAVQASWKTAAPLGDALGGTFFSRLFANDPGVAALLGRVDAHSHRATFLSTLDTLVGALDDPERIVAIVGPLGRRHAGYQVEERHFDGFREALFESLASALGTRFTLELRGAWTEAYALVTSLMLRAMQHERGKPRT